MCKNLTREEEAVFDEVAQVLWTMPVELTSLISQKRYEMVNVFVMFVSKCSNDDVKIKN